MVLNEQIVRNSKPGILWDSSLRGFGLRTGATAKTWVVLVSSGRRKKLGRWPLMSVAAARIEAKRILAEKQLGKIIPKHTAWDDAKAEYLEDCGRRLRPSTLEQYTWQLGQFNFGRKSIGDLTARDITKVLKALTPSNREHGYRALRTMMAYCVSSGIIEHSPMDKMDAPPTGKSRERVLTQDELTKVYGWAKGLDTPHKRFTWLMLRYGQRPGETIRFQWDFIQPDRITLPSTLTGNKKGREHVFPITKEDYETIQTFPRIDDSPYLFPASRSHVRGKPCDVMAINQDFRQSILTETGTEGWVSEEPVR